MKNPLLGGRGDGSQKDLLASLTNFSKLAAAETGADAGEGDQGARKLVTNEGDLGITGTTTDTPSRPSA
jgi:hypothetical protein